MTRGWVSKGGVLSVPAVLAIGCGIYGSALQVKPAGTVNGHELSIGYLEHPDFEKGYLAWVQREGTTWRLEKVVPAWSTRADDSVPPGGERLYVLPREKGGYLVSPTFTASKMYSGPSVGRVEVFECGLNWPHTPGNTPCESALTKKHWSPEGLAGGQRDIDRDVIEAVVRQAAVLDAIVARQAHDVVEYARLGKIMAFTKRVQVRVTRVFDKVGLIGIEPAAATAKANLGRRPGEAVEGAPMKFAVWFGEVARPGTAGDVRCSLKSKEESYSVPFSAEAEPRTIDVEAVVTGCRVSNPRPPSFIASDRTLTARLETFIPGGASGVNLANDSNEFVTVSSVSSYYLDDVNALSNLTIELPPHSKKTFFLQLWKSVSVDVDDVKGKDYRFGIAIKYKKGPSGESTLLREERVPLR
jgi:hypothetical protein